ncbi:MAG: hypothetical protein KAW45_03315 [Thermoplasmatales archaeon]|nr:hypothetical protein [Thermoplasmatales archaeon]
MGKIIGKKLEADGCKEILEQEKIEQEILKDKNLLLNILNEVNAEGIVGEENTTLAMVNKITLRLVKNAEPTSSNLIVSDDSGSGKDYITKRICKVIVPEEKYLHRTDLSPTVLKYWKTDKEGFSWDEYVIHLEDPKENTIQGQTFKTMASGGNVSTITIDNKAVDLKTRGKPVLIVTSLKASIDEEGCRRWDALRVDTSEKQTEIIKQKALKKASGRLKYKPNKSLRHALQYLLYPREVIIPFALELEDLLPNNLIIRTQINKLLDYIKSSAVIHQHSRKKDADDRVIANWFDYDYARFVFLHLKDEEGRALNKDEEELVKILREANKPLSIREVADEYDRHAGSWIYTHLDGFKSKELIREITVWDELANKDIKKILAVDEYKCGELSHSTWFHVGSTETQENQQQEGSPVFLDFWDVCRDINQIREKDGLKPLFIELEKNQEIQIKYSDLTEEKRFSQDKNKTKENQGKPHVEQSQEVLDYCNNLSEQGYNITYDNLVYNFGGAY